MDELGADEVFARIGSEPTGRAFNSVSAVVDMPTHTGNPLVNAGAIATVSLIPAANANDKWNKILAFYGDAAGEKLPLIDEVYKSEAATNQGNRALAALLLKYERIYADPTGIGRCLHQAVFRRREYQATRHDGRHAGQ